jgi:hypothetical protein
VVETHREKALIKMELDELVSAEKARKDGQRSVACQRMIETTELAIQTEFGTTDMSIVTTVASLEKGEGAVGQLNRRRQFPIAVAVQSNSLDMGSALSRPVFAPLKKPSDAKMFQVSFGG